MLSSRFVCKSNARDEIANFVAKSKNTENFSDLCEAWNSTAEETFFLRSAASESVKQSAASVKQDIYVWKQLRTATQQLSHFTQHVIHHAIAVLLHDV